MILLASQDYKIFHLKFNLYSGFGINRIDKPKEMIFEVMKEINKKRAPIGTKIGDAVISNVLGLSVDVISTSNHGM